MNPNPTDGNYSTPTDSDRSSTFSSSPNRPVFHSVLAGAWLRGDGSREMERVFCVSCATDRRPLASESKERFDEKWSNYSVWISPHRFELNNNTRSSIFVERDELTQFRMRFAPLCQ